ncbi:hypothetical protein [Listeria monocytogenes]|uniref:hypothetical protein n=1 Tax=Listeria monocytogenes TaxID=1639 RepID=UPI00027E804B|nr:hypothetical protein [Listeria monocytogenes]CBY67324.1 hypothetical protein LMOL312_1246 [Listeria monocytogenes L312]HAA5957577.1 hypothetical protein [Listeria monocytogenes]HEM2393603.1 hypothetical protein [Listeria monocytogenes]
MKISKPAYLVLLVVGLVFVFLGLSNIGISIFWDFSDLENLMVGSLLIIIGLITLRIRYSFKKKRIEKHCKY